MTPLHRRRLVIALAIMAGIGIFAAANTHLIWTSISSQPECVPHPKAPGQDDQVRAAQPSG